MVYLIILFFIFLAKGIGNWRNKKKNEKNQRENLKKAERFDNDGRNI